MREILFRGKRVDNGEWVQGSLFAEGTRFEIIRCSCNNVGIEGVNVIPETIGQYIGLKDKNDKRIFEGDIFKFDDEVWESYYTSCGTEYGSFIVTNYGVIGFDKDTAHFDFIKYKFNENSVEADLHRNHDIKFSEFVNLLKIIGNIHDNPELLKGSEK